MNISLVITQIKSLATIFGGNVAGAAEYENSVHDQVWLPAPAAYVIPLDMEASDNESLSGLYQHVTERIGVIVALDNTPDRRGQTAVAGINQVQASLFSAILNWRPDSSVDNPNQAAGNPELDHEARGFRLDHANLVGWDRARLFYQWDFALDLTITDSDGWQPPSQPFLEIQGTITNLGTETITGDLVKGQVTVFNVSSIAGLAVGEGISGAGVPPGAMIANPAPSGSQLTLSAPATATQAGVALIVTPAQPVAPTFDILFPQ